MPWLVVDVRAQNCLRMRALARDTDPAADLSPLPTTTVILSSVVAMSFG